MKKYIISLVFVLAAGIPVLGQTSYLSEIKIVDREVAKTADRQARVKMTVSLDGLDIKNQHSLCVVPVILSADGTQEQELPSFVVNGKVRDKVQQRTEAFEHTDLHPGLWRRCAARTVRPKPSITMHLFLSSVG